MPDPSPASATAEGGHFGQPARVEPAPTGRAKCRACGDNIAKGELRLGENINNPFTDGVTTIWFHLDCATYRRPEPLVALQGSDLPKAPELEALLAEARLGVTFPRLTRIAKVERSPSGRAKCRQCRLPIAKGLLRFQLEIFEEARFQSIGFIHLQCQRAYFGAQPSMDRLRRPLAGAGPEDIAEVSAARSDPPQ
ncbi:MAG: hypothetical protein RJA70_2701 [Pseudomonadota bacterium]|jgi:hypothetical protein